MNPQVVLEVRQCRLFSQLSNRQIEGLLEGCETVSLARSEHLFQPGDPLKHYYLVRKGQMQLYRLAFEGHVKVYQIVGEGDMIAESVVVSESGLAPLAAVSLQDCKLLRLKAQHLLTLVSRDPGFARYILAMISERLYQAVNRIDRLTVSNASQRLVLYLADLFRDQGRLWLKLPLSQGMLARQLSIEPETLSRIISRFRNAGVLSIKGRECVLLDIDALCELVKLPGDTFKGDGYGKPVAGGALFRCCNFSDN